MRDDNWTAEWIAKLGTMPDAKLADEMGLSIGAVLKRRTRLGIPACCRAKPLPQSIIERLGTVTDPVLAKEAGVSITTIAQARRNRGIAPSRPDRAYTVVEATGDPARIKRLLKAIRIHKNVSGTNARIIEIALDRLHKESQGFRIA